MEKYGPQQFRLQSSMGATGPLGGQLAQDIENVLVKKVPLDAIPQRRRWREMRMAALAKLKQDMERLDQEEVKQGKAQPLPPDH